MQNWNHLIIPLYLEKFMQTLWSCINDQNRKGGWELKDGTWAPWFFNMREAGDSPSLFYGICNSLADLLWMNDKIDLLIAVEMAGLTIAGGTSIAYWRQGRQIRNGYTRPLPRKARKPDDALKILAELSADVAGYGQKNFVEARFTEWDRVAILDDMSTSLGSKIIARSLVLWEAERRGVSISCDDIFYFLNRGIGNKQAGLDFINADLAFHPAKLNVQYVIEFNEVLPDLKSHMEDDEFRVICEYQKHPDHFQDKDVQREVLALANAA